MNKKKINQIIKLIIYYAIPIVLFLWGCTAIFNNSIWLDEAFSLSLIEHSFRDIIRNTAIDVHPPLYYFILKCLTLILKNFFNENIIWTTKFISLIPIIILLLVNYTIIKKMFSKKTAFLFGIFIVGMPQILKYSIEIRMYSWGMLFVTMVYLYSIKWMKKDLTKNLCIMTIFTIFSVYTHYFAAVSVVCIYLFVLIYLITKKDIKKIKRLIISCLIVFLLYLPWIIILLKQLSVVKANYWIEEMTLNTVIGFFKFPYKVSRSKIITVLTGFLLGSSIVISILKSKDKYSKVAIIGFGVILGTITIGIIASKLIRPVFINRYMICSLGCLWLAVAIVFGENLNKNYVFSSIAILVIVINVYNIQGVLKQEKIYSKETVRTINYITDINTKSTIILYDNNQLQRMVSYYFPNIKNYVYKDEITNLTKQVYKNTNMQTLENLKYLEKNQNSRIYLMAMRQEVVEELKQQGFKYEKCGKFQIETYKFLIYRIWK